MVGRRSVRLYVLGGVAATLIIFGVFVPSTSIPARSQEHFQELLEHSKEWLPKDRIQSLAESATQTAAPPAATKAAGATTGADPTGAAANETTYNDDKWFFEADLLLDLPKFDVAKLRNHAPHNYQGPGHETFATFFSSRNSSMKNPYFLAAQQLIYRTMWDPKSKSTQHPITVFVAPFVAQEQRDYFAAAGAIVRELALVPYVPDNSGVAARLRDLFSKIEMWNQTDFSRILYLDSDAFPLVPLDDVFTFAPDQTCYLDRLQKIEDIDLNKEADRVYASKICHYTFTGYNEGSLGTNAGVLVIKPVVEMYEHLVRATKNHNFDSGLMEQSLLNNVFSPRGPFPPTPLSHRWNAGPDVKDDGRELNVLHAKIWTNFYPRNYWAATMFNDNWKQMLKFYGSKEFERIRAEDKIQIPLSS